MIKDRPVPGKELRAKVRAGFIYRHMNLTEWCTKNGIGRASAEKALVGTWKGPKAQALLDRMIIESGISEEYECYREKPMIKVEDIDIVLTIDGRKVHGKGKLKEVELQDT